MSDTNHYFNAILGLQCLVAWAGEAQAQPARMPWWRSSVMDDLGARYSLDLLLPRTAAWAELEVVRRCASAAERRRRATSQHPDAIRSLFSLGFELDQALEQHLKKMKAERRTPHDTLAWPGDMAPSDTLDRGQLAQVLGAQSNRVEFKTTTLGRELLNTIAPEPTADLDEAHLKEALTFARRLAAAAVPLDDARWPMPYARRGGA